MGYSTWSCNALGSLTGGLFSFTKVVWINFAVYTKMPSMERMSHYQHLGAVPFLISDFSQRLCFSWVMMLALWQPGEEIHRSDYLSPAIDSNAMAITKNIGQNSKVCGLFFCDNQNSINSKARWERLSVITITTVINVVTAISITHYYSIASIFFRRNFSTWIFVYLFCFVLHW